MANYIYDNLLIEKIDIFSNSFKNTSREIFYDDKLNRIYHNGEYGVYRESLVVDFLKFFIPSNLEISTGFIITSLDDVSTQCDIVIFDPNITPLYQGYGKQRFFPIESICAIGEVKSKLSKSDFKLAINKLAKNKSLSERLSDNPCVIKGRNNNGFNRDQIYDLVPSFLICQKLDFDFKKLPHEIDDLYDSDIDYRYRHNIILSIEDGIFSYNALGGKLVPHPHVRGNKNKSRFVMPDDNKYVHFRYFTSYMYTLVSSKTLFYPDPCEYMGEIGGGIKIDQN